MAQVEYFTNFVPKIRHITTKERRRRQFPPYAVSVFWLIQHSLHEHTCERNFAYVISNHQSWEHKILMKMIGCDHLLCALRRQVVGNAPSICPSPERNHKRILIYIMIIIMNHFMIIISTIYGLGVRFSCHSTFGFWCVCLKIGYSGCYSSYMRFMASQHPNVVIQQVICQS